MLTSTYLDYVMVMDVFVNNGIRWFMKSPKDQKLNSAWRQ